jgi:uncharacterized membrane protein
MWNWRTIFGVVVILVVLVATVMPVPAQDPAARHALASPAQISQVASDVDTYQGVISIEGKQVPLPEGTWHLAGHAVFKVDPSAPRRAVVSVALVRLHDLAVDAAVLVQTNKLDTESVWGKATACERTDLYFARVRYASDHDGSCAYAAYVDAATTPDAAIDPAWKQAMLLGTRKGWRFPAHWLEASYRITDPRDAIQIRYLFVPTADGVHPATVQSLVAWTESSWYAIGSGFRNRLTADQGLPDWGRAEDEPAKVLQSLDDQTNETAHIGAKMITYRIFGTLTDMSVNYLWLGSLPSAGGLAIVSAAASSALYFFHELAWNRFEKPATEVGDLPGVGLEVPGPGTS